MGNSKTMKVQNGIRSHSLSESGGDYYATPPEAVWDMLEGLKHNKLSLGKRILEPCCGEGSISETLKSAGYRVYSYDLVDRGYGGVADFLQRKNPFSGSIVTNPPYYKSLPIKMIRRSMDLIPKGELVVFLVKLSFLSGKSRLELFREFPPRLILVHTKRIGCAINGDFSQKITKGMDYCWIVFQKGYTGETQLDWIGGNCHGL